MKKGKKCIIYNFISFSLKWCGCFWAGLVKRRWITGSLVQRCKVMCKVLVFVPASVVHDVQGGCATAAEPGAALANKTGPPPVHVGGPAGPVGGCRYAFDSLFAVEHFLRDPVDWVVARDAHHDVTLQYGCPSPTHVDASHVLLDDRRGAVSSQSVFNFLCHF